MSLIKVEWLSDSSNCELCGSSWAEGARVLINGEQVIDMAPMAHCCGGAHFEPVEVFERILQHLGHTLEND